MNDVQSLNPIIFNHLEKQLWKVEQWGITLFILWLHGSFLFFHTSYWMNLLAFLIYCLLIFSCPEQHDHFDTNKYFM